jgi:hypothetical protein
MAANQAGDGTVTKYALHPNATADLRRLKAELKKESNWGYIDAFAGLWAAKEVTAILDALYRRVEAWKSDGEEVPVNDVLEVLADLITETGGWENGVIPS